LGFNLSCEDKGGVNPPTGQLRVKLAYSDHGTSQLLGSPFSVQGTADELDPVLESAICIGQNPAPGGNELIFLGRYRLTTSPPPGFPGHARVVKRRRHRCADTSSAPSLRWEPEGKLVSHAGSSDRTRLITCATP
jgi:hypothetical protein